MIHPFSRIHCLVKANTEIPKPNKAKVIHSENHRYWEGLNDNPVHISTFFLMMWPTPHTDQLSPRQGDQTGHKWRPRLPGAYRREESANFSRKNGSLPGNSSRSQRGQTCEGECSTQVSKTQGTASRNEVHMVQERKIKLKDCLYSTRMLSNHGLLPQFQLVS